MDKTSSAPLVLITGASGFIGLHCVEQTLKAGYRVRATVRDANDTKKTTHIRRLCENENQLEIVSLELTSDLATWNRVTTDCAYIMHIASPTKVLVPESQGQVQIIGPVLSGIQNILEAAQHSPTVKRIVFTSTAVALMDPRPRGSSFHYTEEHWADPNISNIPYQKGKIYCEKAVIQYMEELGDAATFDVVTLNPGFVVGRLLSPLVHHSLENVIKMFITSPFYVNLVMGSIDVEDVAEMHVKALTNKKFSNQRVLGVSDAPTCIEIIRHCEKVLKELGYTPPPFLLPDSIIPIVAKFDPTFDVIAGGIGVKSTFDKTRVN